MALIAEDGTGLSTANAYITVQGMVDHHTDRGIASISDGTFTSTEMEAALVQASDYVDKRFGRRFRGVRVSGAQALEWPRMDAYDDDDFSFSGIPSQLEKAIAEYALLVLQLERNLAPMPSVDFGVVDPVSGEVSNNSAGRIIEKTEEVGPLKESTKYAGPEVTTHTGNLSQRIPEYPQADLWIEELLVSGTSRSMYRG